MEIQKEEKRAKERRSGEVNDTYEKGGSFTLPPSPLLYF